MADLLSVADLPPGFDYPPEFIRAVELGLTNFEPWWVLTGERLRFTYSGLQKRYPEQHYIPFAGRQDNDDLACWAGVPGEVVVVHDFARVGWERQGTFSDFHAWLRTAVEDFVEWGQEELQLWTRLA